VKTSSVPQPANIYVFLDEHPNSINDAYFDDGDQGVPNSNANTTWSESDAPASYHNGACGFSFSDGHSEIHKWLNPDTDIPVNPGGAYTPPPGPGGAFGPFTDRVWLTTHACTAP
jgi:prepilin-type processing-associated H-X9-DG protein